MNYYEGLQKLKDGTLPSCLILEGNEPYLTEDFLNKLTKEIVQEGTESLNMTRLDGSELDQEALQTALGTMSLFGDRRLVVVRSAQDIKWTNSMKKLLTENDFEGVTVAFVIDKEGGSARTLRSLGTPVTSQSIDRRQMHGWIQKEAKQAGKKMTAEAINEIIDGSRYFEYQSKIDLFFVKSELEKLFSTPEEMIDTERVRSMLSIPAEERVFDMLEAITLAKSERAMELYANLKASGEIYSILALLIKNYEQLVIARVFFESSQSLDALGSVLGLRSSFVLRKIQDRARAHDKKYFLAQLELCLDTLHRSRLETVDMGEVVENLILQLLQRAEKELKK
ncbi:MAG TPA: DNA polymerase III subunit delta [Tissierellia bacterium]|jgi:DNA polymerase III delta subunit|nr:DNA polymerase III subunit delta [Tissierellia bacterium]